MRGARARARECLQVAVDLVEDVVIDGRPDKVDLKPRKKKEKKTVMAPPKTQPSRRVPTSAQCPGAK